MAFRRCTAILAVALWPLACDKSDCEKACEATQECPQVPATFANMDCGDGCDFQEEASESYGCLAQWDTFTACGAANVDRACEANTCSAEAMAWSSCLPD